MAIFPAKAKNITKETFFSLMYSNGATTHTYADLMRYCPFECLDLGEAMGIGSHLIAQYHGFMSVIDTSYNSGFINGTSIFAHTVIANTLQNKDPKYAGLTSKFTNLTQASPNYVAGGSTGEMILAAKKDGTGYYTMLNVGQTKTTGAVIATGNHQGNQVNFITLDSVPRTKTLTSPLILPFIMSFNRNV